MASLNDPELELRVRDKNPADLLECYKTAQILEANQKLVMGEETNRERKREIRRDVQARAINYERETKVKEVNSDTAEMMPKKEHEAIVKELELLVSQLRTERCESNNDQRPSEKVRNQRGRFIRPNQNRTAWVMPNGGNGQNAEPRYAENANGPNNVPGGNWNNFRDRGVPNFNRNGGRDNSFVPRWRDANQSNLNAAAPAFLPSNNVSGRPGGVVCFGCNLPGHVKSECRNWTPFPKGTCYNCGTVGHLRISCPLLRNQGPPGGYDRQNRANSLAVKSANEKSGMNSKHNVYLNVEMEGKPYKFLLDTGCDQTMIPDNLVKGKEILPTDKNVYAANGTNIALKGEVEFDLKVGRQTIRTRALVSEHIGEPILGIDWMTKNEVFWILSKGQIILKGEVFPLVKGKIPSQFCCRIVPQESVMIPKDTEMIFPAKAVFEGTYVKGVVKSNAFDLLMDMNVMEDNLVIARALVPNRCCNIPVRVINATNRDVTIPRERVLAELEEPDRIIEENAEMESGPPEEEWLEKLIGNVDNDLSYEEKGHLKEILLQYKDCFSRSEYDLGHTTVVEHTIDTGNHPPRMIRH
jgi:hypothetical protein